MKRGILGVRGRLLATVVALTCAVGIVCACAQNAFAAEYGVWVSGTQVTSENADDVLGDGTVRYEASGGQHNLWLTDAHLVTAPMPEGYDFGQTDSAAIVGDDDIMVVYLSGTSTITPGPGADESVAMTGITTHANNRYIVINGNGTLDIDLAAGSKTQKLTGILSNYSMLITSEAAVNISLSAHQNSPASLEMTGIWAFDNAVSQGRGLTIEIGKGPGTAIGVDCTAMTHSQQSVGIINVDENDTAYGVRCREGKPYRYLSMDSAPLSIVVKAKSVGCGIDCSDVYLYRNHALRIDISSDTATFGMPAISSGATITRYYDGTIELGGVGRAFDGTVEGDAPSIESAYVSDGVTGGAWDGVTPLFGSESPYTYVRIPMYGSIKRLAGDYANETAASISAEAFPEGSEWVVIARDDDFADALGATGLAGVLNAPIILTDRMQLSEAAQAEIARLGAKKAYIIGGTGAIKEQVDADLAELGVEVQPRLWGENSYDTSLACAKKIGELETGPMMFPMAIVAMSTNFQDALSISSYAYMNHIPLVLQTWGDTSADRGFTDEAKEFLNGRMLLVVGGPGAISEESINSLDLPELPWGSPVTRIYGETGYDTSNAIAEWMSRGSNPQHVVIACGAQPPRGVDALAGSALAGKLHCPILLVNGNADIEDVDTTTLDNYLVDRGWGCAGAYVLGGAYVVPQDTFDRVQELTNTLPAE